jgi:hypothetical protein
MKLTSWYYNRNLKPHGPVPTSEMSELITRGEVGPQDLISAKEDGRWLAAEEWGVFPKHMFPAGQQFIPGIETSPDVKEWVLLVANAEKRVVQEGPFSISDLQEALQAQRIRPEQFVWKAGLTGWSRIADRPEFNETV